MTDHIKDGGPAFPVNDQGFAHRVGTAAVEGVDDPTERDRLYMEATARATAGMTMRDYFAAKAMQALATRPDSYEFDTKNGVEAIAANAYAISDAMLAAREKQS